MDRFGDRSGHAPTVSRRPLEGIRVVDMTRILAGPFCALLLADLGADIIKLESREGDPSRQAGPFKNKFSLHFAGVNRNRKSITLDLREAEGKRVFADLVRHSDVVLENFRPGVMKSLGLDYDALKAIKPDIIMVSISGYGQYGPYVNRSAHNQIVMAFSGVTELTGYPDRPPVRSAIAMGDLSAGNYAALGTVSALFHRQLTGEGQHVDVGMMDAVVSYLATNITEYSGTGVLPTRQGNIQPHRSPHNMYKAKDGYVYITAALDSEWERVAKIIGREDMLSDPRFNSVSARGNNREAVDEVVGNWVGQHTATEVVTILNDAKVPCAPVNTVAEMLEDPQVKAREIVQETAHPQLGNIKVVGPVLKFSSVPKGKLVPAPTLGEHNDEVYGGLLGYPAEKLAQLRRDGII